MKEGRQKRTKNSGVFLRVGGGGWGPGLGRGVWGLGRREVVGFADNSLH